MSLIDFDSENPVAPQKDVTARPPVAPDMGSGIGEQPAREIGGTQNPPALPVGTQLNTDPNAAPGSVEPHHGILLSAFQDLAGGKKTTYRQTENGPVPVKENLQPGEMARSILAAALTGLAGGFKARGKGSTGAFSAGFDAAQASREKKATQKENK